MSDGNLKNRWALVTGASSGLGVALAQELADRGCNLVLVARREDRLRAVQQDIAGSAGVQVEVISMDLSAPDAPQRLYDQVTQDGKKIDVLVNNAGYGTRDKFINIDWEREQNMLQLDIMTVVHLTKLFVKDMVARDYGYVLQVASLGAYQPTPWYASYAAAKSFVLNFSEALNYELRHTNVKVTTLSPGVTLTEFQQVAGHELNRLARGTQMSSEAVARIGIRAMLRGKSSVVPGALNKLFAWGSHLAPRRMATAFASWLMA
ncbi:MAG: SDR family oxidoreductase [Anaerolineae bacterium]|nr:SDR family oxidoreductase [Anaerolineae bacterium]